MSKKHRHVDNEKEKSFGYLFVGVLLLAVILFSTIIWFMNKEMYSGRVRHDDVLTLPEGEIYIEVAGSPESREKGLSGKSSIENNEGMLFIFKASGKYGFWMKDMKFPIDMVWINEDGYIVNMENEVATTTFPNAFINTVSAKYVLELGKGQARKHGLYIGTYVPLSDKVKGIIVE